VVAGVSTLPVLSMTGAALAALVRSQMPAAAATALFRDHDVIAGHARRSEFVATIYWLDRAVDADFVRFFEQKVAPALRKAGANPIAYSQTGNEDLHMFVWLASFDDERAYRQSSAALLASPNWRDWISVDLRHRLKADPQTLRLARTSRLWQ
jgi:hypothetical protein